MSPEARFRSHVLELRDAALQKRNKRLQAQAIRSLCVIVLLLDGWRPSE
jgi:hypothetical protein